MDFYNLIRKRFSVRNYLEQAVEEDKLNYILEAGRVAPTAANRQPHRIIVVKEAAGLASIDKACNRFGAPLILLVCADHDHAWQRSFDGMKSVHIDASIVTTHMMLAATDQGLGSLWICKFDPEIIRQEFSLVQELEPVNILCLGYADESLISEEASDSERHQHRRKPLAELVKYEKY